MKNYISKNKLSKKTKKALDIKKRLSWGEVRPMTKTVPSDKTYKRKAKTKTIEYEKEP
jgi:hypothetical protein